MTAFNGQSSNRPYLTAPHGPEPSTVLPFTTVAVYAQRPSIVLLRMTGWAVGGQFRVAERNNFV